MLSMSCGPGYMLDPHCINSVESNLPIHIYFIKKNPEMFPDRVRQFLENGERQIMFAQNWSDVAELLRLAPKSLCVNADALHNTTLFEIINMVDTFAKLVGINHEIPISLSIHKHTPTRLIKEAQKTKITGIVPSSEDFDLEETLKGLQAQSNNIPYWPKHILNQLDDCKKSAVRLSSKDVKLTNRQQQIFEIVTTRGCSNKQVAKLLNLSESTVKLHMGAIFKKYGVKSRTQLAVFSKTS